MGMFCYQCQETAKGKGCEIVGVCGKNEEVAKLQDLLIHTLKGISEVMIKGKVQVKETLDLNHEVLASLFMTITNANFDQDAIHNQILKMIKLREALKSRVSVQGLSPSATFQVSERKEMLDLAAQVGVLATAHDDVRSLRELII